MPEPSLKLVSPALEVTPGQLIDHKYRVERVIGAGAMGLVVAAMHLELGQRVAIKFLACDQLAVQDPSVNARFRQEARSGAQLRSEHVCRVLDAGCLESGTPFLVMEYLEGQDIDALLMQRGRVSLQDAVHWVRQACVGLADAHALGLVHRDLKPGNLFLARQPDGTQKLKLLDFGISKSLRGGTASPSLTMTSALLGSPLYMSPEQLNSAKDVDARSDIWSLGVILYELVTGRPPFDGDTLPQLVVGVLNREPASFEQVGVKVPPAFEAIVRRCLSKSRSERFASVLELASELEAFEPRVTSRPSLPWASTLQRTSDRLRGSRVVRARSAPRSLFLIGVAAGLLTGAGSWFVCSAADGGQTAAPHRSPPPAAPAAPVAPLLDLELRGDEPSAEPVARESSDEAPDKITPRKRLRASAPRIAEPGPVVTPPSAADDLPDFGGRR